MFAFLSSLPISVLRILDIAANKFYDSSNQLYDAALLTRGYTQHAFCPYIDSEINHTCYFIKISFINKGMEFFYLPNIFQDNSAISSIPIYFRNTGTSIICYKKNKLVRSIIFNFNKLVSDFDIDTNTPETWNCKDSVYCPAAGHIITGNLKIIPGSIIRNIISKGSKCRFPSNIVFNKCRELLLP